MVKYKYIKVPQIPKPIFNCSSTISVLAQANLTNLQMTGYSPYGKSWKRPIRKGKGWTFTSLYADAVGHKNFSQYLQVFLRVLRYSAEVMDRVPSLIE